TIADVDSEIANLTVSVSSSNQVLVPDTNIVVSGDGADKTLTITSATNQYGTTTITLTVSDGQLSASQQFQLEVTAVNDAPTISAIANQITAEDTPLGI